MSSKRLLLIAGIINMLAGIIIFPLTALYFIVGLILIIMSLQTEEDLIKSKGMILFIGVVLILFNCISAILVFLAFSEFKMIDSAKKETAQELASSKNSNGKIKPVVKETVDPEVKRIDILLKLGLAMVLISGILFATTNWTYITDIMKFIFLVFLSVLFFGLSVFSEKKLKLKNTTNAYWILGVSFLDFAWVAICYFGIISPWFSYIGAGRSLVYAITYLLIGLSLYMVERKVSNNFIKYFRYTSFYLSIYNALLFLNINRLLILATLSLITFIINICMKDKNSPLQKFAKLVGYIIWVPLLFNITSNCGLYFTVATIINVINYIYLTIDSKDVSNNAVSSLLINLLLCICACTWNLANGKMLLLFIIISILNLAFKALHKQFAEDFIKNNQIMYSIIAIPIFFIKLYSLPIEALIISVIYLIMNIINSMDETNKFDNYLQPLIIFFVVKSIKMVMDKELLIDVPVFFTFAVLAAIFILINEISTKKPVKDKYYYALLIITAYEFIANFVLLDKIIALIICAILGYSYWNTPKDSADEPLLFTFLMFNIYFTIAEVNLIGYSILFNNVIVILLFALATLYNNRVKNAKVINSVMAVLPLYRIISYEGFNYEWHLITENIFELYLLYLFVSIFIKNTTAKNIITAFGIIIFIIPILFTNSLVIALYVGIFGILLTMFGFLNKQFKSLFSIGIFITVLNIIYQLRELWTMIPFWLYLLVFGLALIIFVMIREVKKLDK